VRGLVRVLKSTVLAVVVGLLLLEGILRLAGWHLTRKFEAGQKRWLDQQDCVTILALGESTTGGLWCDPRDAYPHQLERVLTEKYGRPVCGFIPMHTGQNTSQMYNRFGRYLSTIRPRLVIFMCGANNGWSFEESNIGRHLDLTNPDARSLRLRLVLDRSRVFKLARMTKYGLQAWRKKAKEDLSGAPQLAAWPPPDDDVQFSARNQKAFLELWKSELGEMIDQARGRGANVILMTYPNYDFPAPSDFEALAAAKGVPVVRADMIFKPLLAPGLVDRYFFEDRRHPRPEGYALMATELARLIDEKDLLGMRSDPDRSNVRPK
jgi:lysophospholipase L1-like esterase